MSRLHSFFCILVNLVRDKIEKKKNCFAAKIEKKPDWTFTRFGMSALVKVIASAAIAKRGLFRYQRRRNISLSRSKLPNNNCRGQFSKIPEKNSKKLVV